MLIEKIQVAEIDIIVTAFDGKYRPCYGLKYRFPGDTHYNIGYTSHDIKKVICRKNELFTVVKEEPQNEFIVEGQKWKGKKVLSPAYEMQWIPCSERLPKDGEMVLLSCENPCVLPGIGIYSGVTFYPTTTELTGNRSYESVGIHINAWMPLPEPYKGE